MRSLPLGLLFAAGLGAQTVIKVGPGELPQISHAIAIAAPGDVIEVAAGNYLPFNLDKALTVRAAPGAVVNVTALATLATTRLRPPAGSVAALVRLNFINPQSTFGGNETRIERGTVFCEDCGFESPPNFTVGALNVENATAVLRGCLLVGNGVLAGRAGSYNPGLVCRNGEVFASDSSLRGSNTTFDSYGGGGEGARLSASIAHFVRCTIEGGRQMACIAGPPGRGIYAVGETRLWLADCTVRGGSSACGVGEIGLHHAAAEPARVARNTIVGGAGTTGTGPAVLGTTQADTLLGLGAATQPLVRGAPYRIDYVTQPGWPVLVLVGLELQARSEPLVHEPWLLAGPGFGTLAIVVADGAGNASWQTTVPALPGLLDARLFIQGLTFLSLPFHAAPPLGGVVR